MQRIWLAIVVSVVCLTGPLTAQQLTRVPRIGVLVSADSPRVEAFRHGLREQGYTDGRNVFIEYRYASARSESLDVLARELIHLKVDVIVTEGTPPTLAAKRATDSIPIVVTSAGDLVGTGLVASLARPGGNVTGLTLQSPELSGKRLALLRELVPTATTVAMLLNRGNRLLHPLVWQETETAAKALKITLHRFEVERPDDFEVAFAEMLKQRTVAILVPLDPMFNEQRERLIGLAAKSRLPAMFGERLYVDAGGLVSYGPNYAALYRRAATYVDKILRGAQPADLPVEQPTKFELVINLKTAKALGLTIPQTLLQRADQVIE
jgi:putative ABC transport system substrate-binding protein